jgi:small-conductance mechanosensitive channel
VSTLGEGVRSLQPLGSGIPFSLVASIGTVAAIWLLRALVMRVVSGRPIDIGVAYRWRKVSAYVATGLSLGLLAVLWLKVGQSLATFAGLLSAGLAIALREPMTSFAGWAFILWRRPFQVGDRIQIGDHAGDVVDLRIFQFTLLEIGNWVAADQSTGRIVHVPNGRVFSEVVANYSGEFGCIWNEIAVLITFESDWEKASSLLAEIANEHAAKLSDDAADRLRQAVPRLMIVYSVLTPTVYLRVQSSGVLLTMRYLCEPRRRRSSEHAIWQAILRVFAAHPDIEFAYPTQRLYYRERLSRRSGQSEGLVDGLHEVVSSDDDRPSRSGMEKA